MSGPAVDLIVRPAKAPDLPGLRTLYAHLNHDDPVLTDDVADAVFQRMLDHPGMTVLIGLAQTTVVATVTLVVVPNITRGGAPYALIENVVTHPDHRKRGHARRLLHEAISCGWAAGCYKIMLLTGRHDPAILRFYEQSGFRQDKTGLQIRQP